jgi:diamine N-acetyltransferase
VLSLEQDEANLPFITPWERVQHEGAIRFPDFRHFIIEGGSGLEPVGFLILIGCRSQHQSLELKRMVVRNKGEGYGRAALRMAKKVAFDDLGAHRLWLDVKTRNSRAKALYDREGFVVEGLLRESVRVAGGFESLVLMSMLRHEFAGRRGQGLEMPA